MYLNTWHLLEGDIDFRDMGFVDTVSRHPSRKELPFWIFVIVKKGQRTLLLNGEKLRIGMNEFFLLPPHVRIDPLEYDDHAAYFIHFYMKGNAVEAPVRVDASRLFLPITGLLPGEIDCFAYAEILYSLYRSPYSDKSFLTLQLRALLSLISLSCQKNPKLEKHGPLAEQTLFFIQKNACVPLRAQDYEQALNRSYHHINQIFKTQFGCTAKQYHMRIRMDHAAQMLSLGKSVQDTARDCGFEDYFYFINSFTQAHGISPAAYSKKERFGG